LLILTAIEISRMIQAANLECFLDSLKPAFYKGRLFLRHYFITSS
jgi:hypothetical protein